MSDTEPDVPSGTAQQSPSVMASSSVSANAMALTPGIMPPGKLNVTSAENMVENWRVWKQMWNNYVIIAKLGTQPPEYKVALFLHCIGVDALKIFNGFQFDTPEDRSNLSKIIEKFDQYTIGELNETFERYNFNSRNQEEVIAKIDAENKELYLLGDINCNLLPEANTYDSSHLTNIFDIFGLSQLITEPTSVTPVSKTLIDLCITNSPEKVTNSGVIHLGISDHSLVFLTRKTHYHRNGPRVIETRQFKHFNRGKFLSDLNQLPWANVDLYSDPNDMWREWKEMFLGCVDKHAPLKLKRIRKKRSPWITRELLCKIRKRDFLKKKAISSNNSATWDQFKRARNQANNAIKLAKKRYVSDNLKANKGNSRKTWKVINELTSRNSGKSANILEIKADNRIVSSPMDIAEAINEHFSNVAQVLAPDIPVVDVNPESYLEPTDSLFSLQIPSVNTVFSFLSKIDEKKATGLHRIPSNLLKMAASIVAPSLTSIFSKSILTGIYPNDWKAAKVTPLFKKGLKSDPNNYRPISAIPVVSKVLEKIVYNQLYHYLDDNKLLLGCQSGFRSLHSTLTALLEATDAWSVNIDNGLLNGVVFIDLTKAFDTIDHEIILRKMSYLGVDQATIKWFSSYLSGRTQRCSVNGKLSTARTLSCGVPQGSILGPLLFLIYINDLPNSLQNAVPRMFADDTNLTLSVKTLTELKLALAPELNNLSCWLKANKLSLNVAKTELMIIGSRQRLSAQCDDIEIRIDDQIIERVDHTKSLGLFIDAHLSWCKHVEEICKKVSSAIGALKRVRPFISKETAIQIYNALIIPHFDYCSPVRNCLSGYLSEKLQKLQNRAARVITKSPFDTSSNHLLSTLDWERLFLRRKKQKALMMFKTMNGLAPDYLQSLFSQRHSVYNLRDSEGKLTLPKPNTNYLKRSFSYSGAMLWNNLPKCLKNAVSVNNFKQIIKKIADISDSHTAIM